MFDLIRRTILMYKLISCPAIKLIKPERHLSTSFRAQETQFHHLSISCFGSALWFHLLLCARSIFEKRNYKKRHCQFDILDIYPCGFQPALLQDPDFKWQQSKRFFMYESIFQICHPIKAIMSSVCHYAKHSILVVDRCIA